MIENEFASFDRSIESFFDAAKKKKWRCQIEKNVNNAIKWSKFCWIIYQSRKDFPFNEELDSSFE